MTTNGTAAMRHVGNTTEHDRLDLELYFVTEVLGLPSLHYGYWEETPRDEEYGLDSLAEAQARFTERLLALVPPGTKSALDVGSGIGDNSAALAKRGISVTALSPDRNHRKFYDRLKPHGVEFHNLRFEDLDVARRFDVVLMSESQNYFDVGVGLQRARKYLNPGGHLVIAGLFRRTDSKEFRSVPCIEKPYIERAKKEGFALEHAIDVTDNVLPTIMFAERYLKPCLVMAEHYLGSASFVKRWLVALLVGRRSMSVKRLRAYYEERLTPSYFRTHIKYMFLQFRLVD